jgi:hypothetical protein
MTDTIRFDGIREADPETIDRELPHLVVQDGLLSLGALQPSTIAAVNELLLEHIAKAEPNIGVTRVLAEAFPDSSTLAVELSTLIQSMVIKCLAAIANREAPVQQVADPVEFVSALLLSLGTNVRAHGLSPETMTWFESACAGVAQATASSGEPAGGAGGEASGADE